jgi:hypothetical protein
MCQRAANALGRLARGVNKSGEGQDLSMNAEELYVHPMCQRLANALKCMYGLCEGGSES